MALTLSICHLQIHRWRNRICQLSVWSRAMSVRRYEDKDHAHVYAQYRPIYPDSVYKTILAFCENGKGRNCNYELAVDVGCGNGQSTVPLCKSFKHVIGCDVSQQQIAFAPKDNSNLIFRVGPGEDLGFLKDDSVDLITSFQAVHWLDINKFYNEVRRVTKPGGVFVAYGCDVCTLDEERAQSALLQYANDFVFPYLNEPSKICFVDRYKNIGHPFTEHERIEGEDINMHKQMSTEAFVGYLSTAASWRNYAREHPDSLVLESMTEKFNNITMAT